MNKHSTVDEYVAALSPPLRDAAEAVRGVVRDTAPDAEEAIRWAQPTWKDPRGEMLCYLRGASRYVTFGFWRGKALDDPEGLLDPSGERMAHVKLRTAADVDSVAEQLRAFVEQAVQLARASSSASAT